MKDIEAEVAKLASTSTTIPLKMWETVSSNDPDKDLMQFFEYAHLKPDLQAISAPICELARKMFADLPSNSEKTKGLDLLLQAKDALVRAKLYRK